MHEVSAGYSVWSWSGVLLRSSFLLQIKIAEEWRRLNAFCPEAAAVPEILKLFRPRKKNEMVDIRVARKPHQNMFGIYSKRSSEGAAGELRWLLFANRDKFWRQQLTIVIKYHTSPQLLEYRKSTTFTSIHIEFKEKFEVKYPRRSEIFAGISFQQRSFAHHDLIKWSNPL